MFRKKNWIYFDQNFYDLRFEIPFLKSCFSESTLFKFAEILLYDFWKFGTHCYYRKFSNFRSLLNFALLKNTQSIKRIDIKLLNIFEIFSGTESLNPNYRLRIDVLLSNLAKCALIFWKYSIVYEKTRPKFLITVITHVNLQLS